MFTIQLEKNDSNGVEPPWICIRLEDILGQPDCPYSSLWRRLIRKRGEPQIAAYSLFLNFLRIIILQCFFKAYCRLRIEDKRKAKKGCDCVFICRHRERERGRRDEKWTSVMWKIKGRWCWVHSPWYNGTTAASIIIRNMISQVVRQF